MDITDQEQNTETETTPTTTPEAESELDVDVTEASDEDLDAFIKKHEEGADDEEDSTEEEKPEARKEQKPQPPAVQTDAKPKAEKPTEEPKTDPETLQKRLRDKELFIQRQAAEIGRLRKLEQQRITQAKEALKNEAFMEQPERAMDAKLEIREAESKIKELDENERQLISRHIVQAHIENPSPELPQAMLDCLAQDKVTPEFLAQFAENPVAHASTGELIQLGKRAQAVLVIRELLAHVDDLTKQLAEANKKPERMMGKIEKAFATPPRVNGKSGQTLAPDGVSRKQLAQMSDSEFSAYEKEVLGANS